MTYLERSKYLLRELKVSGVTIPDIVDLEKELGIYLPEAYKEFLLWMGKNPDKFLIGSDIDYSYLCRLQVWARETLKENNQEELPDNAFVFFMHQGYIINYFLLDTGEDPIVYLYDEQITRGCESLELTFSQWLISEANYYLGQKRAENYELN